jgi:hypothetical protein
LRNLRELLVAKILDSPPARVTESQQVPREHVNAGPEGVVIFFPVLRTAEDLRVRASLRPLSSKDSQDVLAGVRSHPQHGFIG